MNLKTNIRYAILLVYLLGNALTYNHLVRMGQSTVDLPNDAGFLVLKSLLLSMIWPLYWLYRAVVG